MMANNNTNNIKLGIFVISGLVLLVAALFFIGKDQNFFGGDAELKARFSNAYGLQKGNNVFFSGINAGTVKSVILCDDATIEVTMLINNEVMVHIPKNSVVSIGTEGLMGNKVVNISPATGETMKVSDGDFLLPEKKANIDDMLETLSKSNNNIAAVSGALRNTARQIEHSRLLQVIDDNQLAEDLKSSMRNLSAAMHNTNNMTIGLNSLVEGVKNGEGTAGLLLSDKEFAAEIKRTMANIEKASIQINNVSNELNTVSQALTSAVKSNGPLNTILTDTLLSRQIRTSVDNIEKGTENFNQNMEALKDNFLVRGYFRKQEKQKADKKNQQ
jgi:phospholipid/cholesterol/gamma-HCH transport system substrate-binding protein